MVNTDHITSDWSILMEIIRERHPESSEACARLMRRMTEKEKIRKASLIDREISTE